MYSTINPKTPNDTLCLPFKTEKKSQIKRFIKKKYINT